MKEFNNDKLWLAFEASGCVGDYLNYRVSKIILSEPVSHKTATTFINAVEKDTWHGFKDNWCCDQTT